MRLRFALIVSALACAFGPEMAEAQRALDVQLGSWEVVGSNPTLYSAGVGRRFWGPLAYDLRGLALIDSDSTDASLFGLAPELSLFRGNRTLAPYAVGGVGLAVQPGGSSDAAALWYAGLGLEWNPLSWVGLAVDASYLAEDGRFQGFWNLQADDRHGWLGSARLAIRWGGGSRGDVVTATTPSASQGAGPYELDVSMPKYTEPMSESASGALAGYIVETALNAMGEPYRWGGTSTDQGFDCSGLVWYAYTTHGIAVPRVSRDQARAGRGIPRDVTSLEPGDILLFASGGSTVTHVGLYIGDARFIHATPSGGVRIGTLLGGDTNDLWWRERWVGARRVLR